LSAGCRNRLPSLVTGRFQGREINRVGVFCRVSNPRHRSLLSAAQDATWCEPSHARSRACIRRNSARGEDGLLSVRCVDGHSPWILQGTYVRECSVQMSSIPRMTIKQQGRNRVRFVCHQSVRQLAGPSWLAYCGGNGKGRSISSASQSKFADQIQERRSLGFAHRFRPTYAWANGHSSCCLWGWLCLGIIGEIWRRGSESNRRIKVLQFFMQFVTA
jgi:hypothetical protein